MKIRFKKFQATDTFVKLFGAGRDKTSTDATKEGEAEEAYEYYYKRGNTYYFRNSEGKKFSITYTDPRKELIKGNLYTMDAISNDIK